MNREILDRWCERGILTLVLAILVFGPVALGAVRASEFLIVQGLTVGVVLLWVARLWLNRRAQLLWPPVCWALLAFVGYAIWRCLNCDIEYVGRQELIRALVYALLFFAILNNLHRQESTQIIGFSLIFLAVAISCYAIYQFLTVSNWVLFFPAEYRGRGSGTYINPNHLAGFLEMLLPLALAYALAGRGKPVTKIFLAYAALVMVVGIAVTLSRGGWVACGLSLVLLFSVLTMYRSSRLPAVLLLAVLLGGGIYLAPKSFQLKHRLGRTVGTKQEVLDVRYILWQTAVAMWRDNVWVGVGPGHYDHRFRAYRSEAAQLDPDLVHNDYLNTLADWGVIGSGLVAAMLAALFAGVLKCWRYVRRAEVEFKSNLSNKFAFVVGSSFGLVALLAHSFVDFNLHIPANAILATGLAALLTAHLRFATEAYWVTLQPWMKPLVSIVLLAGATYLGFQIEQIGKECHWLNRAEAFPEYSNERMEALKNAHAAEPANFETSYQIGELIRMQSFEGGEKYAELANEAMLWYGRATNANPHDAFYYLRYGMCLDYIGRHDEAWPYFAQADVLDPNGFFTAAHMGWHYFQVENYAAAKPWFERSLRLMWNGNDTAITYLPIVKERLATSLLDRIGLPAQPPPGGQDWTNQPVPP